jgi:membrane protein implicated in regulation of membrane protease activity
MDKQNKQAALAAFLILAGVAIVAYFLPTLMLAAVDVSPWLAAALMGLVIVSFFAIFWLRGRYQRRATPPKDH